MKLTPKIKNVLLVIGIIIMPLIIIGLFHVWSYIGREIGCHHSTEDLIKCRLESICEKKGITNHCISKLYESISETIDKAVNEDDPTICEEIEPKLRFACYHKFAKELEFTLNEVFINNLKGQDEELCNSCKGLARKKCFFNLAIEKQNQDLCKKTEKYRERCESNIILLQKNLTHNELSRLIRSRKTKEAVELNIKLSQLWHSNSYFFVEQRLLKLYNGGNKELNGKKINLYQNLKLVNIVGCKRNSVIHPKELVKYINGRSTNSCYLEFNQKINNEILEVTYDGETALTIE